MQDHLRQRIGDFFLAVRQTRLRSGLYIVACWLIGLAVATLVLVLTRGTRFEHPELFLVINLLVAAVLMYPLVRRGVPIWAEDRDSPRFWESGWVGSLSAWLTASVWRVALLAVTAAILGLLVEGFLNRIH